MEIFHPTETKGIYLSLLTKNNDLGIKCKSCFLLLKNLHQLKIESEISVYRNQLFLEQGKLKKRQIDQKRG